MRYMVIEVITLVLSCLAVIGAIISLWLALNAKIEVEAMKRSTHSVQLVPVDKLVGLETDTDRAMENLSTDKKAPILDLLDDAL